MSAWEVQRCPSGVPTGNVIGRAGTYRAGLKRLRTLSRGGRDRDLALVHGGRVVTSSGALMIPCVCEHERDMHEDCPAIHRPTGKQVIVEKCVAMNCDCIFYRPRTGRVSLSVVQHDIVPATPEQPPANPQGRILTP